MLIYDIRWKVDEVEIEFFNIDGSRHTDVLPIAEVVDLQGWLTQERLRIIDTYRRHQPKNVGKDIVN
jgi:hypothetical protein